MSDMFVVNSAGTKWSITKDPNAILDYIFDWTLWLDAVGDTLATHVAAVTGSDPASTAAIAASSISGKMVIVWVSGGVLGETVSLRCRITTSLSPQPRTDDRTAYLKIRER